MAQIEWRDEFSLGIATIDAEHRQLIAEINQLYDQLGLPMDALTIEALLAELQADISVHFALEELLMEQDGYAEFEAHRQDHHRLLDQIHDMIFQFEEDPHAGRELLKSTLSDWFGEHFTSFDARLHGLLNLPPGNRQRLS
jgi:hemerythrin